MSRCAIEPAPGGYRVTTPYDSAFLFEFKQTVPHSARQWQKPYWIVDAAYGQQLVSLIGTYFGERVTLPRAQPIAIAPEIRAIDMRYLGRCKDRGDGQSSAYGYASGAWSVVLPENVLRAWFCDDVTVELSEPHTPAKPQTLYAVLGIKKGADEQAIKTAYRRLARQWHPDVCRESDAKDQFIKLQAAYEVLSDPVKRRKYHAGLELSKAWEQSQKRSEDYARRRAEELAAEGYRAPLRCGYVLAEGQPKLGRFVVSKILDWSDIVRSDGKTLVASWDMDAESIREEWV